MNKVLLVVSTTLFSLPAMAYIDPGSGSAIISAIIGFFVAIGLVIKTYWYKLKSLFVGKNRVEKVDANTEKNIEEKQQ